MPAPHLILERLEKRFAGGPAVVEALSIEVQKGELLGLLGPSGCGKTTTLRMISGLIAASAGRVVVSGRDVTTLPPHRRDMGVVFQNYALFPHMSVAQNLAFGLDMRRIPRAELAGRVQRALDLVRLSGFADRRPKQLSGGQQQRVALARALVIEPSILLLDEPLSNLDASLREEMRGEIRDIQQRLGITTVFVTHDQTEALAVCDTIAVMRSGRLEQLGTPWEVYERPANAFVAEFVGRINRLKAQRGTDGRIALGSVTLAGSRVGPAGPVLLMIRPHRIVLASDRQEAGDWHELPGVIRRTTFVGDVLSCAVEIDTGAAGGASLTFERHTQGGPQPFHTGDAVVLSWRDADMLVFQEPV